MSDEHVVIVGAGHGGGALAAQLRNDGHAGPITLVGSERVHPYQRPPLSKAWLAGEVDEAALALRPAAFYAERGITLRLGETVAALELAGRRVLLESGEAIGFDRLVLATGARARRLAVAGAELDGVVSLRDAADASRLRACLIPGGRIAIVGGGYIGLEVAASARKLGVEAVVIEREARLLARVACRTLSDFYELLHRAHGVRFHFSASLAAIEGRAGRVTDVRLDDGTVLACDSVLIGVGAVPNDELARAAGIACANGVVVDEAGRTSAADVFAIGDVTWRPMPLYGRMARLESVPNALEQGRQVSAAITGKPAPKPEVPWFWSDQYDVKLQIAGVAFEADRMVVRGDPRSERFAVFHLLGGRLVAVEAINAAAEFMAGRTMILAGKSPDPARLADPAVPMKQLLAA